MSFYDTVREAYHSGASYADTDTIYYPVDKLNEIIDKRFKIITQDRDAGRIYDLYSKMCAEQNKTKRAWVKTHLNACYGNMVCEEHISKDNDYWNYWNHCYPKFDTLPFENVVLKYCENDAKIVEEIYKENNMRRDYIVVHARDNQPCVVRKDAITVVDKIEGRDGEECRIWINSGDVFVVIEAYADIVKRLFE